MGRRLGAVDAAAPPRLRALAVFLREVKADCEVTFELMARHNRPKPGGASTFIAAVTGHRLPSHASVRVFLAAAWAARAAVVARAAGAAAGGTPVTGFTPAAVPPRGLVERADRLWLAAHVEHAFAGLGRERPPYPKPERVRTGQQLAEAVKTLYRRAGSPPLRYLEVRMGEAACPVAPTVIGLMVGGRLRPSRRELEALVTALGLPQRSVAAWLAAWERVEERERAAAAHDLVMGAGPVLCADSDPAVQRRREQREQHEELLRKMGKLAPGEDYDEWLERREEPVAWWDRLTEEELAEWEREAEEASQVHRRDAG